MSKEYYKNQLVLANIALNLRYANRDDLQMKSYDINENEILKRIDWEAMDKMDENASD